MLSWPLQPEHNWVLCDWDCHLRRNSKAPGLDIAAPEFTPVLATADGKVLRSRTTDRAGRSLWIDHGQGTRGFYSHLSVAMVLEGEWVKRGQIVGLVGHTGIETTQPHLHFGLKFMGNWIDPARVMLAQPGQT